MSYSLGVDLGTTYSAAAIWTPESTQMVTLGYAATVVPSAVFVTPEGETLVGEPALRRGAADPERLSREFKRRIGDSVPLMLGGSPFSAEALSARVLAWIVRTVASQEGGPPERLALTYPANWGPFKRERLAQVVRLADLAALGVGTEVVTLTEPEAAAMSYAAAERVPPGTVVAVYDLGGGTFDGAVLRKTEVGFVGLGSPEGIERLGGIDVDEAVFQYVARTLGDEFDALPADDVATTRALTRLRNECVEAKEALSSDTEVSIPVVLPMLQTEIRLTRSELEAMVRPVLDDTVAALRRAIASADLTPADIDRVLLVGGSSRIPLVAELVTQALERPVFVDAHPKHAVALGAALLAGAGGGAPRELAATAADLAGPAAAAAGMALSPPAPVAPPGPPPPSGPPPSPGPAAPPGPPGPFPMPPGPPGAPGPSPAPPAPPDAPPPWAPSGPSPSAAGSTTGTPGAESAMAGDRGFFEAPTGPLGVDGDTTVERPDRAGDDSGSEWAPTAPPDGRQRSRGRGRGRLVALGVAAVVALVVAAVLVARGGGDGDRDGGTTSGSSTTGEGTSDTGPAGPLVHQVGTPVPVPEFPDGIAVVDDTLWVASTRGSFVSRIDAASGTVDLPVPLDGEPLAVLSAEGSIWVTQRAIDTVARIDPDTGEVVDTIDAPGKPVDLAVGAGSIWVVGSEGDVTRIDPGDNTSETVLSDIPALSAVVATDERVWLTYGENQVGIVDPATNVFTGDWATVGSDPDEAELGETALWVANRGEGTVSQLDRETGEEIRRVTTGAEPAGLYVDPSGDFVWVIDNTNGRVTQVDAGNGNVLNETQVGTAPLAITRLADRLWITLSEDAAVVPVTLSDP